jgi:hypothetical protein
MIPKKISWRPPKNRIATGKDGKPGTGFPEIPVLIAIKNPYGMDNIATIRPTYLATLSGPILNEVFLQ